MLAPLAPQRNLSSEVIDRIRSEISTGGLLPGARLPTEQAMMTSMRVSRTVVREAVAALRARGLVVTRQGSGAYVSDAPLAQGFVVEPDFQRSIEAAINVLELRRAVELETAGLAAERATVSSIKDIERAHRRFEVAVSAGESAADEDFAFHLAIARATGNPNFPGFLNYLGHIVIPRQRLAAFGRVAAHSADYMAMVQADHATITAAVASRDSRAARAAMHAHLTRSIQRYRSLAKSSEGRASEGRASEGRASEGRASEGRASEGRASRVRSSRA